MISQISFLPNDNHLEIWATTIQYSEIPEKIGIIINPDVNNPKIEFYEPMSIVDIEMILKKIKREKSK